MAERKIEYEFEDLRRNEDDLPPNVVAALGSDREDDDDTDDVNDELESKDDDDGDDDGGDEKMLPMSEVNKRLARVRRESQKRVEEAKAEAAEVIGDLQKRVSTIETTGEQDKLDTGYQAKLDDINAQIDTAVEAGDSKEVARLTAEMSKLTTENVVARENLKRKNEVHDDPDDLSKQAQPKVIPRAKDWLAEQTWWDDPEHDAVKAYVNRLDRVLQEKGYKPSDDDFYLQLEEAVEKKHPGVIIHTMDEADDDDDGDEFGDIPSKKVNRQAKQRRAARKSPAGGNTDQTGGRARRGGKNNGKGKTLNRDQIANMRMFGMDPTKPDHVEAYLAEIK